MMLSSDWHDFLSPIWLSLRVSVVSSILVFVVGLTAAWFMTQKRVKAKILIETIFMLPLVLPPTVVGFVLLVLLGRRSFFGKAIEAIFQQPIVFTWWAAVIAAVVVAFPLVFQTIKVGLQSIDRDLTDSGRSIGANDWQMLRYLLLPLAWRSMLTAYMLGFARGLGEFGATLMIAGNIPHRTQTIPTAIYLAVDSGNTTLAWLWTGSMMVISFLLLLVVYRKAHPPR
jgi:molybdate transport system permease protein